MLYRLSRVFNQFVSYIKCPSRSTRQSSSRRSKLEDKLDRIVRRLESLERKIDTNHKNLSLSTEEVKQQLNQFHREVALGF